MRHEICSPVPNLHIFETGKGNYLHCQAFILPHHRSITVIVCRHVQVNLHIAHVSKLGASIQIHIKVQTICSVHHLTLLPRK